MHTSSHPGRLIGVAGGALNRRNLAGMRIFLDGGMAIATFENAVYACAKLLRIHTDTMSGGVLQGLVRMAGETIRLRPGNAWHRNKQKRGPGNGQRMEKSSLHVGSD
jgi:hypothetical protein